MAQNEIKTKCLNPSYINIYNYLDISNKKTEKTIKIIDSKFIEKINKTNELLNKIKSTFFLKERKKYNIL